MSEAQDIQWFPGHMTRTKRKILEDLKQVDVVCELIDARIPQSSRNPVLDDIIKSKKRLVIMNKSDMADPSQTAKWLSFYKKSGSSALALDAKNGKGIKAIFPALREILNEQIAAWNRKGMTGRPIRVMIVGVPNVGKSSLINKLIQGGRAGKAAVQDRPGITRRNSWFTIGKGFELLDTPGVLWPKFEDKLVGEHLAFTGAVRDEVIDIEDLAARLLELIMRLYKTNINQRYKTNFREDNPPKGYEMLEEIGKKRGMLIAGGEIDIQRAAIAVLDEYREGLIGRITLEQIFL